MRTGSGSGGCSEFEDTLGREGEERGKVRERDRIYTYKMCPFSKYKRLLFFSRTHASPPSTKDPTQEIKPDRKELNGKVPTRQQ